MAIDTNDKANKFANPKNGVDMKDTVNCGCEDNAKCKANFEYVYDSGADTITFTDKSFVESGDGIVAINGISIVVKDSVVPVPGETAPVTGDDTADIVVNVAALDATGTFRIEYSIVTDTGCTDTGVLFITPSAAGDATGSLDPYNAIR